MSALSDKAIDEAFCKELGLLFGRLMGLIIDPETKNTAKTRTRKGIEDAYLARSIMQALVTEIEHVDKETVRDSDRKPGGD
jgi:hypothetical protein